MENRHMEIRRLRPGDEAVVRELAEREPQTRVLADERTIFLAAFEAGEAVGFVLGPRPRFAPIARAEVIEPGAGRVLLGRREVNAQPPVAGFVHGEGVVIAAVERLTHRTVLTLLSGSDGDGGSSIEAFVLEPAAP